MSGRKPLLPNPNPHLVGKTMGGMAKEQEEKHHYSKTLRQDPNPGRYSYGGTTKKKYHQKLKTVARGQKSEYRKAYTKHGARLHKKGLLHPPKVEI